MNRFSHSSGYRLAAFAAALGIAALALHVNAQQLDCSDQVKAALQVTANKCDQITRNTACYGNTLVVATANDGVQPQDFVFQAPGDSVKVPTLKSLRLASLDQTNNQWGIAYLRIQANLPDTAAGQYVTMLMFGDTHLQDQSQTVSTAANQVNPMQAVYFRTGVGSPACNTVPTSGLIIQAPQGLQQPVKMTVDGVQLGISSTVFIQAEADDLDTQLPVYEAPTGTVSPTSTPTNTPPPTNTPRVPSKVTPTLRTLKIATIEGRVTVTANGQTRTIRTGQQLSVPLDAQSTQPINDAQNPLPAVQPFNAQGLLALLVQPGVDNVLLVPTLTSTPLPARLPRLPPPTWTNTFVPPATNKPPPPATNVPPPPANTSTPSLTRTNAPTRTSTPTRTNTSTNTPTHTPSFTSTHTNTPTNTSTYTPTNTATNTSTSTNTFTPTKTPTNTPTLSALVVTNLNDSGNGSLRAVIAAAPSGATITFSVTGTITLLSTITVNQNLTIAGPGAYALTISGGNAVQIFNVAAVTITLSGLTFANGNSSGAPGGAIVAPQALVTITNCEFTGNTAAFGGALYSIGATINGSTFSSNSAAQGGAINNSGSDVITNSTFYNNTSTGGSGGAIDNVGGSVTLVQTTIFGNSAGGGSGGGIYNSGTLTLQQTIVAGDVGSGAPDISGAVTSSGYNLIGNTAGSSGWLATDLLNVSPNLEGYAYYGGPTHTLMPPVGSPAVDVIPFDACATLVDQRGVARPQPTATSGCDIGAVERQASDPRPPPGGSHPHNPPSPTRMPTLIPTATATPTLAPTRTHAYTPSATPLFHVGK